MNIQTFKDKHASQVFDGNFSLAEISGPNLRDPFREHYQIKNPQSKILPQIIAVTHNDKTLKTILNLIDTLPRRSKIGIEAGWLQAATEKTQKFYSKSNSYFTEIALYARRKGHSVYPLERNDAFMTPRQLFMLRRIDELVNQSESKAKGSPEWKKLVSERMDLLEKLRASGGGVPLRSAWRSELMARAIVRVEWRASDIVITGSAHAINLSELFKKPVDLFIGEYQNQSQLKREIQEVMTGQKELAHLLEIKRKRQRSINSFFQKIRSLIGR